jgi:hypothetical protein
LELGYVEGYMEMLVPISIYQWFNYFFNEKIVLINANNYIL